MWQPFYKWSQIVPVHTAGTANSTVSLSGIVTNLNSNESNERNLSAKVSTLCMALLLFGKLLCAEYKYRSLK